MARPEIHHHKHALMLSCSKLWRPHPREPDFHQRNQINDPPGAAPVRCSHTTRCESFDGLVATQVEAVEEQLVLLATTSDPTLQIPVCGDGGYSSDAGGFIVVVGAPFDGNNGTESGSVYVYTRFHFGYWTEQAKLTPSVDGSSNGAWFGIAVAIDNETAVIGAPGAEESSIAGKAYVFQRFFGSQWTLQETFISLAMLTISGEAWHIIMEPSQWETIETMIVTELK